MSSKGTDCKFCTPRDTRVNSNEGFANILAEIEVPAGALGEFANEVWHIRKNGRHYIECMLCNRLTGEDIAPAIYEITYCPVCGRRLTD